jgi:hypothetical protein
MRVRELVVCASLVLGFGVGSARADTEQVERENDRPRALSNAPKEDEDGLFAVFGWSMHVASAGDVATTEWALAQPGFYEQNPLMSHRGVRVAAHVVAPAAVWWASRKVREKGHRRAALLMRIGLTAVYGYAAIHNLRTLHSR